MAKLTGAQPIVLKTILDLAHVPSAVVTDVQIQQATRINIEDIEEVRNWLRTLEESEYVNLVSTSDGLSASITPQGRLALALYLKDPSQKSGSSTPVKPGVSSALPDREDTETKPVLEDGAERKPDLDDASLPTPPVTPLPDPGDVEIAQTLNPDPVLPALSARALCFGVLAFAIICSALFAILFLMKPPQRLFRKAVLRTSANISAPADPPKMFRIGIVAYDNIDSRAQNIKQCFNSLKYDVKFAKGTAEEVLDWINEGTVDIGVVSPGAFAATDAVLAPEQLELPVAELPAWKCKYLITPGLLGSDNPFASPERRQPGQFEYDHLCLINKQSLSALQAKLASTGIELRNPKDPAEVIKKAAAKGWVQFVFGDPLSLSGTIFPRAQLANMRIFSGQEDEADKDVGPRQHAKLDEYSELSFGLSDTLGMLMDDADRKVVIRGTERHRVGFVFDGTMRTMPEGQRAEAWAKGEMDAMKRDLVPVKLLAEEKLPAEVWVVRPDFEEGKAGAASQLRQELLGLSRDRHPFKDQTLQIQGFGKRIKDWAKQGGVRLGNRDTKRWSSVSEILDSMRHFHRAGGSPRLALVLSGGGAKCAYQAGAIASIERQIASLREIKQLAPASEGSDQGLKPDISLVVGSSGGALNALPTALGLTRNGEQSPLLDIWQSIYLTDLFDPSTWVKGTLGVSVGLGLLFLTWLLGEPLVRWGNRSIASGQQRRWLPPLLIRLPLILRIVLAAVLFVFACARCYDSSLVKHLVWYDEYYLYLVWLPLYLGDIWALLVLAVGTWLSEWGRAHLPWLSKARFEIKCWRAFGCWTMAVAFFAVSVLRQERSLSVNEPMKRVVVDQFEELLGCPAPEHDIEVRARKLSNAIYDMPRPRDLMIAVTVVGKDGAADRFLKVPANEHINNIGYTASGIRRGTELHVFEKKDQLIKLVTASATIFPIFRSEMFPGERAHQENLNIVDGGYAHNIPVEAAVVWGATHIIVIEATPILDRAEKPTFAENLWTAYELLFSQAQLTDMRSRQRVEIYTLRPQAEILKLLDFAPVFTTKAFQQGQRDADANKFRQYSRAPQFEDEKAVSVTTQ